MTIKNCPCGTGKSYDECCAPYHLGAQIPPTAEALMRSRYSAYALKRADYLLTTWHPDTRPKSLDLQDSSTKWVGLKIRFTEAGLQNDQKGIVEFVACYQNNSSPGELHEKSYFVRMDSRWFYHNGIID